MKYHTWLTRLGCLKRLQSLLKDKKIEGITEIRDESDKDGLRVVIEVRKGDSVEVLRK